MQPMKHTAQHAKHASTARNEVDAKHSRWPSALALSFAILRTSLISSSSVTIREPNAMEPKDSVDARMKADVVGCLG